MFLPLFTKFFLISPLHYFHHVLPFTTSKSKLESSLWGTFGAPNQNRLLTFDVAIFMFLFQIHSSSLIPSFRGSFEKLLTVYFYIFIYNLYIYILKIKTV